MGIKALTAVRALFGRDAQTVIPPQERLLLMLLADSHNDETGETWPAVATLARDAGLSVRRARADLASLEAKGLIVRRTRTKENGGQTSNGYQIAGVDYPVATDPPDASSLPPRTVPTAPPGRQRPTPPDASVLQTVTLTGTITRTLTTTTHNANGTHENTDAKHLLSAWRERTGRTLNAHQVRGGLDWLERFALRGDVAPFYAVMDQAADDGWKWSTFLTVCGEEYEGTRRKREPVSIQARRGARVPSAPVRSVQQAADYWASPAGRAELEAGIRASLADAIAQGAEVSEQEWGEYFQAGYQVADLRARYDATRERVRVAR